MCIFGGYVFRMYSKTESYYDPTITFDDSYKQIPKNVDSLLDCYNEDEAKISVMIEHQNKT